MEINEFYFWIIFATSILSFVLILLKILGVFKNLRYYLKARQLIQKEQNIKTENPVIQVYSINISKYIYKWYKNPRFDLEKKYEEIITNTPFKEETCYWKPLAVRAATIVFTVTWGMNDVNTEIVLKFVKDKFSDRPEIYHHNLNIIDELNRKYKIEQATLTTEIIWMWFERYGRKEGES